MPGRRHSAGQRPARWTSVYRLPGRRHRPRHDRGAAQPSSSSPSSRSSTAAPASAWRSSTASCRSTAAAAASTASPAAAPRITVELPRRPRPRQAPAPPSAVRGVTPCERARLLVVDDEASLLDFLSLLFQGEGYEVDTAALGRRGAPAAGRAQLRPGAVRHHDARRQRPRPAARDQGCRATQLGGDHDDRLHLDQVGDRGDEARRLRLHLEAVRRRRAQGGRAEGAREEPSWWTRTSTCGASSSSSYGFNNIIGQRPARCRRSSPSSSASRAPTRRS